MRSGGFCTRIAWGISDPGCAGAEMTIDFVRAAAFLAGLFVLLSWEFSAPDHRATVPRRRRWIANLSLAAMNGGIISLVCAVCYTFAARQMLPWRVGPFERFVLAPWLRICLEILTLDLIIYLLHRAYHRVPLLWKFHEVHHTDLDLDVTSASRFHTGEIVISGLAKLASIAALGNSPMGLVTFETIMLLAAQFEHSNIRLPKRLDRFLWYTFVPPSMHRIHHNPERQDMDSNYGTIITAWDRLFGTLNRRKYGKIEFGLEGFRDSGALGLLTLLAMPFQGRSS